MVSEVPRASAELEFANLRCAGPPQGRWRRGARSTVAAPSCSRCSCVAVKKQDGRRPSTTQRFRCHRCRRTFTARPGTPFAGHRWPLEVITTAVRWSCRYRLSAADVRDLLAERRIDVAARTVLAWAHTFGPLLAAEGRRHARPVGARWWTDETYVRVGARWTYLYRAVDEVSQVIDVLLRAQRDLASARAFFAQAIARRGSVRGRWSRTRTPAAAGPCAGAPGAPGPFAPASTAPAGGRRSPSSARVPVKERLRLMRGLQSIATGQRLLKGIELAHAIRRGHLRASLGPGGSANPSAFPTRCGERVR